MRRSSGRQRVCATRHFLLILDLGAVGCQGQRTTLDRLVCFRAPRENAVIACKFVNVHMCNMWLRFRAAMIVVRALYTCAMYIYFAIS